MRSGIQLTLFLEALALIGLMSCSTSSTESTSLAEDFNDSTLLVGDHLFVSKNVGSDSFHNCDPRLMAGYENISPLARQILSGEEFNLAKDDEALALLDSMLNGSTEEIRRLYFLIATRSLARSDGYYSEGVGSWGTQHFLNNTAEFLSSWSECLSSLDQEKWAWHLAAEENIESEGFPPDDVLSDYYSRLYKPSVQIPTEHIAARDQLYATIDSIYRRLAEDDRPIGPR